MKNEKALRKNNLKFVKEHITLKIKKCLVKTLLEFFCILTQHSKKVYFNTINFILVKLHLYKKNCLSFLEIL